MISVQKGLRCTTNKSFFFTGNPNRGLCIAGSHFKYLRGIPAPPRRMLRACDENKYK